MVADWITTEKVLWNKLFKLQCINRPVLILLSSKHSFLKKWLTKLISCNWRKTSLSVIHSINHTAVYLSVIHNINHTAVYLSGHLLVTPSPPTHTPSPQEVLGSPLYVITSLALLGGISSLIFLPTGHLQTYVLLQVPWVKLFILQQLSQVPSVMRPICKQRLSNRLS